MKEMLSSSTNWILFVMVGILAYLTIFTMMFYPDSIFKDVFAVFTNILTGFAGYKYGKSLPQQNTTTTSTSQDIKPLDTLPG